MALVEVARFWDLTEAEVAASMLRANDIPVLIQNEIAGAVYFYMQQAFGGFRLWAPQEDAETARSLLKDCHERAPPARITGSHSGAVAVAVLGLLDPLLGWAVVKLWPRPRRGGEHPPEA